MKLILIDGGPASGKNTLGELIIKKLNNSNEHAILLDLDTYVEQLNSKWIWDNEEQKNIDQLKARVNIAKDIDSYLQKDFTVIVIGERFLTLEHIKKFVGRLSADCSIYLYHLSVPFTLREERLHQRGPHSLIDLAKDQSDRDAIKEWPGYIYENINSPEVDSVNLISLIQEDKGFVSQRENLI